jgi:hypothetical protein
MDFTPSQIAIIEKIVDSKLAEIQSQNISIKSFHSIPEIRNIIKKNLENLMTDLRDDEFDIQVFRFVLKRYMALRPDDFEVVADRQMRWERQVSAAIRPESWGSGCPFAHASKAGRFKFVSNFITSSLFD